MYGNLPSLLRVFLKKLPVFLMKLYIHSVSTYSVHNISTLCEVKTCLLHMYKKTVYDYQYLNIKFERTKSLNWEFFPRNWEKNPYFLTLGK
jgi:hypothetical protein